MKKRVIILGSLLFTLSILLSPKTVSAEFPSVASTATSAQTTAANNQVISYPSGIEADDLLIAVLTIGVPTRTFTWPAGWNVFFDQNSGGTSNDHARTIVAWKKADGTETGTFTVVANGTTRSAHIVYRITGAEDPTTQPPQSSAKATSLDTNQPNPPTVTPTGGAKNYLFIAVGSIDLSSSATLAPTNYSSLLTRNDTSDQTIATAVRQLNTSSEDPDAFTFALASRAIANTIAVHPSPVVVSTATIENVLPNDQTILQNASLDIGAEFNWCDAEYAMSFDIVVTRPNGSPQTITSINGPDNGYPDCSTDPGEEGYTYSGKYIFSTPGEYIVRYHGFAQGSAVGIAAEPDIYRYITVTTVMYPPAVQLSADGEAVDSITISSGDGVALSWSSTNTSSCDAAPWSTVTQVSYASEFIYPTTTTEYLITCVNSDGTSVTDTLTVLTGQDSQVNIDADLTTIEYAATTTLSWTGDGTCIGTSNPVHSNWNNTPKPTFMPPKGIPGATGEEVSPTQTTTFTVTCTYSGNTYSSSITISVVPAGSVGYTLSNPSDITITKPGSVETYVTKNWIGGSALVDLTISNDELLSQSGVSHAISNNPENLPCSNCDSTISFTLPNTVTNGVYPITVTGTPGPETTSFNLRVTGDEFCSGPLCVVCIPTTADEPELATSSQVGEEVTWTAYVTPAGAYTYTWHGPALPSPVPTTSSFTTTYSTIGTKNTWVTVDDGAGNTANCSIETFKVKILPKWLEI